MAYCEKVREELGELKGIFQILIYIKESDCRWEILNNIDYSAPL